MLRNKRQLASVVILFISAAFILAALFIGTDKVSLAPIIKKTVFESPNPQLPAISATVKYEFAATGSISAQNPIEITVTLYDINATNLLDYYQAVGFLGAVFNSNTNVTAKNNSETYGFVKFEGQPDGMYNGTSMLIWQAESDVYAFLVPQSWYPWKLNSGPAAGQTPIAHISVIADTLAWKYTEENTRLMLIAIGFSVLMLQPVFGAVFRLRDKNSKA
jgi:hypothetical protein